MDLTPLKYAPLKYGMAFDELYAIDSRGDFECFPARGGHGLSCRGNVSVGNLHDAVRGQGVDLVGRVPEHALEHRAGMLTKARRGLRR